MGRLVSVPAPSRRSDPFRPSRAHAAARSLSALQLADNELIPLRAALGIDTIMTLEPGRLVPES